MPRSRAASIAGFALLGAALAGGCAMPGPASAPYQPRRREITITAVPLLTHEMQHLYPFLVRDFARGGVLAGKEVYAFEPSTVTVVAGDTLALTLVNPEDDAHSFVLPDLEVGMPPESTVTARYVAGTPGIYRYTCTIPSHLPFMVGTLVVLPPTHLHAR